MSKELLSPKYNIQISVDQTTAEETFTVTDADGREVTDKAVIDALNAQESIQKLRADAHANAFQNAQERFVLITRMWERGEAMKTDADFIREREDIAHPTYERQPFDVPKPDREAIQKKLEARALTEVKSLLFWKQKDLRREFVAEQLPAELKRQESEWETLRSAHDLCESGRASKAEQEYQDALRHVQERLDGVPEAVKLGLDALFVDRLTLPITFNVSWQVVDSAVRLELELPPINVFPTVTPSLTDGRYRVTPISGENREAIYRKALPGIAIFLTSLVFNVSPAVTEVSVKGFHDTEHTNAAPVYDLCFDRPTFSALEMNRLDPSESLPRFQGAFAI